MTASGTFSAADAGLSRRNFLRTGAAGAGLTLLGAAGAAGADKPAPKPAAPVGEGEKINVALVGIGAQGRVIMESCNNIPNLNFVAVCDIWEFARTYGQRYLSRFGHSPSAHAEFDDMLEQAGNKGLHAVIVATPDIYHAPYTVKALEKGFHVYCEKMMSNTIDGARSMVRAMKDSNRLCQIGHQRRSNPRYIHALDKVMRSGMLGRVVNVNGQWNRSIQGSLDLEWPKKYEIGQEILETYGYKNMHEFRNWRWYRNYSGGPISDLGAHQIDIFGWFLDAKPKSVMASGGSDYFKDREWYDNVMAIFEYEAANGDVTRAFYQVLTTTTAGAGYYEMFMGTDGSLRMSENPAITRVYKEGHADWAEQVRKNIVREIEVPETIPTSLSQAALLDVRATADLAAFELPVELTKLAHTPHLENFFDAVRGKAKLTCPADEAFKHEAAVFKVNPAVEAKKQLVFEPSDFEV